MKLFKIIGMLTTCLFFTGCAEEVITVDLETAPPKLVIDASIDWVKNTVGNQQKIILSTSTGYYNAEFPTVSGANISISNSQNTSFVFTETSNSGVYICTNFNPVIGETYTLTVLLNGETYKATEVLMATAEIEGDIIQNSTGGVTGDEMEIQFSFNDDGNQDDFYMTGIKSTRIAYPEYNLESDERYQGKKMVQFYSNKDLKQGDEMEIKLYGVSKRFFNYFKKIILATGNDDSPFSTTPTAVRGNIVNQTNSTNFPYGYFRLSEVEVKNYTIK